MVLRETKNLYKRWILLTLLAIPFNILNQPAVCLVELFAFLSRREQTTSNFREVLSTFSQ